MIKSDSLFARFFDPTNCRARSLVGWTQPYKEGSPCDFFAPNPSKVMLVSDIDLPNGFVKEIAIVVPDFPLLDIVQRAHDDGLDVDLQVRREQDGSFVLVVHVLLGMLVVDECEVPLGTVVGNPWVLWLWAACLEEDARRVRGKVSAAIRSGRT